MKKCYKHINDDFKTPLLLFDNQKCPICMAEEEIKKLTSDNSTLCGSDTKESSPKVTQ